MWNVITQLLQSKKAVVAIVAVVAQVAGHFGFHIDQTELTTALSPLYAYILGQAIADHGKAAAQVGALRPLAQPTEALASSAAAAMTKTLVALLLVVVVGASMTACSSTQKTEEKAVLACLGNEDVVLAQAISDKNVAALTIDLYNCAKQALAMKSTPATGSGSAK